MLLSTYNIYLESILIAEVEDEDIGSRASQSVVTKVRPFEMSTNRKVRNCRKIGNFQFVQTIGEHNAWIKRFSSLGRSVFFKKFAPNELLKKKMYKKNLSNEQTYSRGGKKIEGNSVTG